MTQIRRMIAEVKVSQESRPTAFVLITKLRLGDAWEKLQLQVIEFVVNPSKVTLKF